MGASMRRASFGRSRTACGISTDLRTRRRQAESACRASESRSRGPPEPQRNPSHRRRPFVSPGFPHYAMTIHSERLDLVPLTPVFLRAALGHNLAEAGQILELSLPPGLLDFSD